ncbi:MAG: HpcH/HpaI aldolase/citrate lyase family protein [Salaquimonas sp.]|nr:HpcH/HpaI aldolase/citrate lyase family protein [Salaquimonas sp.]
MWSALCNPQVAEMLAQSKFDWVLFDAEHSPTEIAGLLPLLQAAGNGTAAAAVRPPWNDPVLIKRALDIGAQTLILPFVQNEEEARNAVSSVRYPPNGWRGVAGSTRASRYGRDTGYLGSASDDICLIVQAETAEALSHIEAIAGVDGVDGVFVGPSDLSASMGHLGNPGAPQVQDAIYEAAQKIRAAGKAPGILATTVEDARRYIDWGFMFVACNVDLKLLIQAVDQLYVDVKA